MLRASHWLKYLAIAALGLFAFGWGDGWVVVIGGLPLGAVHLGVVLMALGFGLLVRRLFASPTVFVRPGMVAARTPTLARALTLGGWDKSLVIDTAARKIYVEQRVAWLLSGSETIDFASVSHIVYRHQGTAGFDRFDVALALHDGRRETLFSFLGEVDDAQTTSSEEDGSRYFVELLKRTLGVTMSPRPADVPAIDEVPELQAQPASAPARASWG